MALIPSFSGQPITAQSVREVVGAGDLTIHGDIHLHGRLIHHSDMGMMGEAVLTAHMDQLEARLNEALARIEELEKR